ncbi:DNA polymerase Y family protein [Ramlibacter sp. G-1-2-2]|uniref:DNA polymerase Y family protein n=1 Tax=Ramlibacter agri TaxID=2728837 RepID=A0A848H207_9BURK|nr:DNA polymerase Y family protein [Ramlibacter agri]NML44507.1 DNA polymerase Y family protein [Ramlibacter agri]
MLWAALLPDAQPAGSSPSTEVLHGTATWALQYTPRVAVMEAQAVAMELAASTRLFGGKRRLVERIRNEAGELGLRAPSWAPTSLAALALARAGLTNGFGKPLEQVLDAIPLETLTAARAHEATLSRLGCRTLGDVRALPRGGLSRRFDAQLLKALDQAYGLRPESHAWVPLPDRFAQRLELMSRVELAPALLFGARRLLLQMCGWLAARQSGLTAFTLRWCHDVMRSKTAGDGGELTVRTAEATRNLEHLSRLLAEHLAKVELKAPVGDLELIADEVHALEEKSGTLLPDAVQSGESLALVLERVAARLGPERVLRPVPVADHRMEWTTHWQPAAAPQPRTMAEAGGLPQPGFILPRPLKLAVQADVPLYQGPLLLLSGPHRIESGWWHRRRDAEGHEREQTVVRDYYVALSEHAGVLWIFQTRLDQERTAWFLQGVFA